MTQLLGPIPVTPVSVRGKPLKYHLMTRIVWGGIQTPAQSFQNLILTLWLPPQLQSLLVFASGLGRLA